MSDEIIIDDEFRDLIPPLADHEREQLEKLLVAHGCRDSLVVWEIGSKRTLIDGHNRFEICNRLGIKFKTVAIDLPDRDAVLVWIIDNQDGRRNLNAFVRGELQVKRKEILARDAKRRQKTGKGDDGSGGRGKKKNLEATLPQGFENGSDKKTRAKMAKAAKVSDGTMHKIEALVKKAPAKVIEKLRRAETTINKEYNAIVKGEKRKAQVEAVKSAKLPKGKYHVIVADPPWAYESRAEDATHRAANPYPSMNGEAIKAMPVADMAHTDCLLWLWTTNAFMVQAHEVAAAWGFEVKTILTWVKDRFGTGDWLRGQTEHCLMCVRGKPVVTLTNQSTVLNGPMREHSRKPDAFYELVGALCPGKKVEMFSREQRAGWDCCGAEVGKFSAKAV